MKYLLILTLIFSAAVFGACQKTSVESAAANEIKQISVKETAEAVKKENVQFIDVRTPEEYAAGRAPKAANFPLDKLENDLAKLDRDKPVYVICQTGRRSQKGAEILQKAGFKDLYNVTGGTSEWISAGLPTEK